MADQAEATGVSVSYVSAIETNNRPAPDGYAMKVAKWLGLEGSQTRELLESAARATNVVKFRPRNPNAASLAFAIAKNLNELTPGDILEIKKILESGDCGYE